MAEMAQMAGSDLAYAKIDIQQNSSQWVISRNGKGFYCCNLTRFDTGPVERFKISSNINAFL